MTADVKLFLNWRTIPSGIAWGNEVDRTEPRAGTLRVSLMPSFHFEPCDSGAGGTTPNPPLEIPPGLLAPLANWPQLLTQLQFRVQVEQASKIAAGISENYTTANSFDLAPSPQPTAREVKLGCTIFRSTLDRKVVTRAPVDGSCGQIMKGRHSTRVRRFRGYDDMPNPNRQGISLADTHSSRVTQTLGALNGALHASSIPDGGVIVGAPRLDRKVSGELYQNYRVFFPANVSFADRVDSRDADKLWRTGYPGSVSGCELDLQRLAGNDGSDYRHRLYDWAILGVSLLHIDAVPRSANPNIPLGQGPFGIDEALDRLTDSPPTIAAALVSGVFNIPMPYLTRAQEIWKTLRDPDPNGGRAYLNLLHYYIATHHEPVACSSSHGGTPADDCRDIDNLLAGLTSWPTIARLTGLCIEFEIDQSQLLAAMSGVGAGPYALRILVKDPRPTTYPPTLHEVSCWSTFTWSTQQGIAYDFWPAPRPGRGELVAGTLNLPGNYQLRNIDIDADVHHATRHKQSLDIAEGDGLAAQDLEVLEKGSVDCGIALVATAATDEAANSQSDEQEQVSSLGQQLGILLYADDLVAGYRIDVNSELTGDRWLSICARDINYQLQLDGFAATEPELKPLPLDAARAEGMVHKTARTTTGDQNQDEVTPHNILCQWRDQNIAVRDDIGPRSADNSTDSDNASAGQSPVKCEFPFTVQPAVPDNSQPRLRSDVHYYLGGRVTFANGSSLGRNLASRAYNGNLPGVAATRLGDNGDSSAPFALTRNEPIQPPATHLAEPINGTLYPGDEIDTIVVRSATDFPANDRSARWIVAPRTSLENAEIEGALDSLDDLPDGALRDFKLDSCGAVPSVAFLHPDRCRGNGTSAPHCVDTLLERRDSGWTDPQIPYYPDPAARSLLAALVDDPSGASGYQLGKILWYSRLRPWPDAPAIYLTVARSHSGPVVLRAGSRVLTTHAESPDHQLHLELPPGTVTYLQLWSSPSEKSDVETKNLATVQALFKDASLRDRHGRLSRTFHAALRKSVPDQSWPMLNPRKTIRLVHAVQKPLQIPRFGHDFAARRFIDANANSGSTVQGPTSWNRIATRKGAHRNAALLEGTVEADRKSTGRIDIRAERYDWIDDPTAKSGPCRVHIWDDLPPVEPIDPTVQHDSISLQTDDTGSERNIWHELKDTKHHHVAYHLTATSAFRNYFRRRPHHEQEDAPNFTVKSDQEHPEGRRVHILSTIRPDVPILDLILPTFVHEAEYRDGESRLRRRAGLKLWLNRPWFSSGNDEKLAIICGPSNLLPNRLMPDAEEAEPRINRWTQDDLDVSGPDNTSLLPYISQIALDPTAPDGKLVEALAPGVFLDPRKPEGRCPTDTNLVLAESAGKTTGPPMTVSAALFDVGIDDYDCDRQQYGVNVGIDLTALAWQQGTLAFRPFIRLALARYQPYSVSGTELSRILVADMIQLQPNRTLQITYDPDRVDLVDVNVYEYGAGEAALYGNISSATTANYVVRIELLSRLGAHAPWISQDTRTVKIEQPGDGYLARARFPLEKGAPASQYAIRVHEEIWRRHGAVPGVVNKVPWPQDSDTFDGTDDIAQPVLHLLQPLRRAQTEESA